MLLGTAPTRAQTVPDSFAVETLAPGLDSPCGFEFLPDGRVLFVEQVTARVRLFRGAGGVQARPVMTVPGVVSGGERGLLGVAVDPGFPLRPYLYLYYNTGPVNHIRIARFTMSGDLTGVGLDDLVGDTLSRYDVIDDIPDATPEHNGGTLRFGVDGLLYAGIGEDGVPCAAQDSVSLRGVLLRLRTDALPPGPGAAYRAQIAPADNPFAASPDSNLRLVAALGLRNPFRFQVDRVTGTLVIGDVGESAREEIDLLAPPLATASGPLAGAAALGADFGWPYREGLLIGVHVNDCGTPPPAGLTDPVFDYDRTSQAFGAAIISAGAYRAVAGGARNWPAAYDGDLFANDYYAGDLRRVTHTTAGWGLAPMVPGQASAVAWGSGFSQISDWRLGPDGALWFCRQSVGFAANTGSLGRISGPGGPPPNQPAGLSLTLQISPAHGSAQLAVIVASGPVSLRIVDLGGRAVRTLLDHAAPGAPPGMPFTVTWDGLGDDGVAARPGVYVAMIEADGRRAGVRIPFLR